jgi:hypothetical protein
MELGPAIAICVIISLCFGGFFGLFYHSQVPNEENIQYNPAEVVENPIETNTV